MLLDRLEREGASLECLRLLALNCVAGRRMELAERFLERIRELSIAEEDEFEYLNTLGRIYRGVEKLEEAMEWYRRALERTTTDELAVYRVHCHFANCLRRLGRNGSMKPLRTLRSRFEVIGTSTVIASVFKPASLTRRIMSSEMPRSLAV